MSTIRTWVLQDLEGECVEIAVLGERDLCDNERVAVFERDPVLDLLERAYWSVMTHQTTDPVAMMLREDLESVLSAHGYELSIERAKLYAHGRLGGET